MCQVKHQEAENKKLATKLKILKYQEAYEGKIEGVVKQLEEELKQQIDKLLSDQAKLEDELFQNQEEVENSKKRWQLNVVDTSCRRPALKFWCHFGLRYEDELLKKAELENEFIVTKKVLSLLWLLFQTL